MAGADRFQDNLEMMYGFRVTGIIKYMWMVFTPIFTMVSAWHALHARTCMYSLAFYHLRRRPHHYHCHHHRYLHHRRRCHHHYVYLCHHHQQHQHRRRNRYLNHLIRCSDVPYSWLRYDLRQRSDFCRVKSVVVVNPCTTLVRGTEGWVTCYNLVC